MPKINKQKVFDCIFGGDTKVEKDKLITEFEAEERNPFVTVRLNKVQVKKLSEYISLLPFMEFRALALYYCMGCTCKQIARTIGMDKVKGLILYCEDRLTQCMGLPRPIAARYWRHACSKALDIYPFPKDGS